MVNKVILIGNAGADPEIRTLESGVKMARLRIATSERYFNTSTGEKKEHTEWHTITLWRSQADFAEKFIQKGTQVFIEGKIRTRDFTDNFNNRRTIVEIHADDIKTLGRRANPYDNNNNNQDQDSVDTNDSVPNPDNLPF